MSGLTPEQRLRIEENKRKAMAKLAEKRANAGVTSGVKAAKVQAHSDKSGHISNVSNSASVMRAPDTVKASTTCTANLPLREKTRETQKPVTQFSISKTSGYSRNGSSNIPSYTPSSACDSAFPKSKPSSTFYGSVANQRHPLKSHQQSVSNLQKPFGGGMQRKPTTYKPNSGTTLSDGVYNPVKSVPSGRTSSTLFGVKGRCVLCSREQFRVEVGFHTTMVETFKTMKTKQYDAASKVWCFKLEEYEALMQKLRVLRPGVDIEPLPAAVRMTFRPQLAGKYPSNEIPEADLTSVDPILQQSLMPFQRTGVSFGVWRKGRVLIADDMGLGKTIQAICLACYYRHEWPLLVVVPSSVRFDWAEQLRRWIPSLDPQSINVIATGKDRCSSGQVVVISYDLMSRKVEELKGRHFEVIIMDESHLLKNTKTARTKAALPLLQAARRVILLTGTPALSRPSELFTQIVAVSPGLFKFHDYGVRYCDGKELQWGWDFSGCSNMGELQLLLEEKLMIRRLKKEVLSQLPSKLRKMVLLDPCSVKSSKHLQKASATMNYENLKGMERRGMLLEYFHETARAKVNAVRDYVLDLLENGQKFLLFGHHQELLDSIETALNNKMSGSYIRIDGRTPSEQRKHLCDRFQSSDAVRVAVLSITAANAGLNLTAASLVVFAELFWNPGILVQAEDRVHRIGQQDSVNIHYLVAPGTADDHIWPLVQNKLSVLSKAGLSKEDFSEADTCQVKDSKQKDLRDFFEESFFEEDFEVTEDQGVTTGDGLESSPKKRPSTSLESPRKTPKKQTGIQQFFRQQTDVANNNKSDCKYDQLNPFDEFEDDCDWLDDIASWECNEGEPSCKKLKT